MNIQETITALKNNEITSSALTDACIEVIRKRDPELHAFITLSQELAREEAKRYTMTTIKTAVDGIPFVLKDNISVKGMRMTAASKILDTYVSPYNATVVDRLAGGILMGKANLDAFAFGASTENSGYFVTKNPWDTTRVAGGSSGGVAAAVATHMAHFGIGTDTGGSIRQPAAFCGVVGLKPTYGRSSRYGLAAMGSSLDCPGPITTSVYDAAYLLNLISGYDVHDATSADIPVPDFTAFSDIKGLRIGVPKEFFDEKSVSALDAGVYTRVKETIQVLKSLGGNITEVSIPHFAAALPVYYIITPSEISANMSRYDGIRFGYAPVNIDKLPIYALYERSREVLEEEVKRRIFIGNYSLSSGYYDAYYNKAMEVRSVLMHEIEEAYETVDVLVGPTSPTPAFRIGENTADPIAMYLADVYTVSANIAGIPAISIPCGFSHNLPVGFQIMARQFDEKHMLDVAFALEKELAFRLPETTENI